MTLGILMLVAMDLIAKRSINDFQRYGMKQSVLVMEHHLGNKIIILSVILLRVTAPSLSCVGLRCHLIIPSRIL